MGIDRPDDASVPPDKPSPHPPDRPPAETRNRHEYYADQAKNGQQPATATSWEETAELSRWMWTEYKRRWPPEERPPVDKSKDAPGSWHGDGDRVLKPADNQQIEAHCDRIAAREREKITPTLCAIESQDPHRHLVGLKDCVKGRDRIKEKVAKSMAEKGLTAKEAISRIPDTIRYTLQYDEAQYAQGVSADVARIRSQGFKLDILKNSWSSDQYKGVNSQWIEPQTGQRFEVQFHTRISFEAKQITHDSYERLRMMKADKFEEMVLEAFQKKVSAEVPIPPGVADIPDYPQRGRDA